MTFKYEREQPMSMKSQQCGYLNKTSTMTAAVDMSMWMEEISLSSTARGMKNDRELMTAKGKLSSPGMSH